jgi:hypothetical protein
MTDRWSDYVIAYEDDGEGVEELWRAARAEKGATPTVYVLGEGFDPRALVGLERYLASETSAGLFVLTVALRPDRPPVVPDERTTVEYANENRRMLQELAAKYGVRVDRVPFPAVVDAGSAGLQVGRNLAAAEHVRTARRIIVDASALPASMAFPIIGALLQAHDNGVTSAEIQVLVCENAELDAAIINEGVGPAAPIAGFRRFLDREAREKPVRIWAPVLGRGEAEALRAIRTRIEPRDICPVLPFPARNPRRGDDLIAEFRQVLFETMQVDTNNIIYADEMNPFDLYRTLSRLHQRYRQTLKPLGASEVVVSSHASKLLSLGMLLAAYENELSIVSASSLAYSLDPKSDVPALLKHNRLVCLWVAGTPYRA